MAKKSVIEVQILAKKGRQARKSKKKENKRKRKRKKDKEKHKERGKKKGKMAEKATTPESLTGARVHPKAKNKRTLRNAFCAQNCKTLFLHGF